MKRIISFFLWGIIWIIFLGCNENPISPEKDLYQKTFVLYSGDIITISPEEQLQYLGQVMTRTAGFLCSNKLGELKVRDDIYFADIYGKPYRHTFNINRKNYKTELVISGNFVKVRFLKK